MSTCRSEHDFLGPCNVPSGALYGVHTVRSLENFPLTHRRVHPAWVHAMGEVKLACAKTSYALGAWADDAAKAEAIIEACLDVSKGMLDAEVVVDALQGGAGTSLNMNVNEVIANRALQILGEPLGSYARVSPLDDINYQQSTNDVCPTAFKIALSRQIVAFLPTLKTLEQALRRLGDRTWDVVKVGRTQYQDAVLTTLGFEFKAYAEALARDFVRLSRARNELHSVNLGGTAIGTSVSASKLYVQTVVGMLADVTQLPLQQNHDLIDGTQNLDIFAYVSGIFKALAVSLLKISTDLRFMSSGPVAGIGEISLPPRQAGSSIMPGKVNPVIPEAMAQICMLVIGHDASITYATSQGNLELNAFLPLVADCMLGDLDRLAAACHMFTTHCIQGIVAHPDKCKAGLASSTALITAMVDRIGYDRACQLGLDAVAEGISIRDKLIQSGLVTEAEIDSFTSAKAVQATMADKARSGALPKC
ncbi:MAG: aspartate ammonia-lyase [Proteobacteria bacterium]|nr:aspartate ammonia-lyase [Pseudomonadota bacterium]